METETYKVAKELLEKYDPAALRDKNAISSNVNKAAVDSGLRYRGPSSPLQPMRYNPQQPSPNRSLNTSQGPTTPVSNNTVSQQPRPMPMGFNPQTPGGQIMMRPLPQPRLTRPILPQDRGMMDKLVDYVVGDGPSNRYALICRWCHSHNGMALKDEFEYIAFRCCYCMGLNPPRKERPFAPRLTQPALPPLVDEPESDSDRSSEKTRGSFDIVDVSSPLRPKDATPQEGDTQIENAASTERTSFSEEEEEEKDTSPNEEVDANAKQDSFIKGEEPEKTLTE